MGTVPIQLWGMDRVSVQPNYVVRVPKSYGTWAGLHIELSDVGRVPVELWVMGRVPVELWNMVRAPVELWHMGRVSVYNMGRIP